MSAQTTPAPAPATTGQQQPAPVSQPMPDHTLYRQIESLEARLNIAADPNRGSHR